MGADIFEGTMMTRNKAFKNHVREMVEYSRSQGRNDSYESVLTRERSRFEKFWARAVASHFFTEDEIGVITKFAHETPHLNIAVVGKTSSGKTTVAVAVAKLLADIRGGSVAIAARTGCDREFLCSPEWVRPPSSGSTVLIADEVLPEGVDADDVVRIVHTGTMETPEEKRAILRGFGLTPDIIVECSRGELVRVSARLM